MIYYYQKEHLFEFNVVEQAVCFTAIATISFGIAAALWVMVEGPADRVVRSLIKK